MNKAQYGLQQNKGNVKQNRDNAELNRLKSKNLARIIIKIKNKKKEKEKIKKVKP